MMLYLIFAVILASVFAEENWPRDIKTVTVNCSPAAGTLFQCKANWGEIFENGANDVCGRINAFTSLVLAREDVPKVSEDEKKFVYATYQGNELYNDAVNFFGCGQVTDESMQMTEEGFILSSYYLDYFSNNIFTVSYVDEKEVVGFSGGVFSAEGIPYDEAFMDAFRDVTIQYKIQIEGFEDAYYAIGYMGTFSIPYFYSNAHNEYVSEFSVAYSSDYDWSVKYGGSFSKYLELFNEGNTRVIPPGIFMVNFIAPYHPEVNTVDPFGEITANTGEVPNPLAPINAILFKYMFGLRYGLRNEASMSFMESVLAYSASDINMDERYSSIEGGSWNFCRSLGRNNIADAEPTNPDEDYDYSFVEEGNAEYEEILCNAGNLPSVFFMTYTPGDKKPLIYSTKYQLMTDGSCQYRSDLGKNGFPVTTETYVKFGESYKPENEGEEYIDGIYLEEDEAIEGLPSKTVFVLNGNDIFGIHVVDKNGSSYEEQDGDNDDYVPSKYTNYVLNNGHISNLFYDSLSMCNTGISDNYVLYDMKSYANVYGSIGAISHDSYGVAAVYNSMRSFPSKSNYTSVVSAAQFGEDDAEMKTQLQKCVNVFLDTQGNVVAACNDVTSTWNWAVFGGSFAGICIVVGLWVWGALYNKKFNQNLPPYYPDLVSYEPEWKRIQAEKEAEKEAKKLKKKGRKANVEQAKEENNNPSTSDEDSN